MIVSFHVVPFHTFVITATHDVAAPIWSPTKGTGGLRIVLAGGQLEEAYFCHHFGAPHDAMSEFVVGCEDPIGVFAGEEVMKAFLGDVRGSLCPDFSVEGGGWVLIVFVSQAPNGCISVAIGQGK